MKTAASSSPCAQLTSHSSKRQKKCGKSLPNSNPIILNTFYWPPLFLMLLHSFACIFAACLEGPTIEKKKTKLYFYNFNKKYICIHKKKCRRLKDKK